MASLFPRSFISHPSFTDPSPSSFHPLFRLLDDFDQYSRSSGTNNEGSRHHHRSVMKTFTPRFDVKETADAYELHGDLPGIEQKDITIEFTDSETLSIRGRTERSYSSGTPPTSAGAIESSKGQAAIKDKAHQPTVEDETAVATSSSDNNAVKEAPKEEEPKERYWVTERSVGEFQRTFTFPVRVDQENVKASMRNGVLTVVVPKGKKAEPRRIEIN